MTRQTITIPIRFDLDGTNLARALAAHVSHVGGYRDLDRWEANEAIGAQLEQGGTHLLTTCNSTFNAEAVQWAVAQVRRLWPQLDGPHLAEFETEYTK